MSSAGVAQFPSEPISTEAVFTAPAILSTKEWVHSLVYQQFSLLDASSIQHLTPQQAASIPDVGWFSTISAPARSALNVEQVQALKVSTVRIYLLSAQQINWLTTAQIRSIGLHDFKYLSPAQIPLLSGPQIASIPDPGPLAEWSQASIAALTQPQVQALQVRTIGLQPLSIAQRAQLTIAQIRTLTFHDFKHLTSWQVPYLTAPQISTIPDPGPFTQWSPEARAALTPTQVQALNVAQTRITLLNPTQVSWLTPAQVRSLAFYDFNFLTPSQVPNLSPQQIATIPQIGSFALWSEQARAALTPSQVQALNVAQTRITLLTPTQISWLTPAQVGSLYFYDFNFLPPAQVPNLSPQQIATIPQIGSFALWSEQARAALTPSQVQALNVATNRITLLTSMQISWLTPAQVRSLFIHDFNYLTPAQVPNLSIQQVASIPHIGSFALWSPEARQALTQWQVQALQVRTIGLQPLSIVQRAQLTIAQIRTLTFHDFEYLTSWQVPYLTAPQISTIPDPGPFTKWSDQARAALTPTQVQALNVAQTRITLLTPVQISWLTPAQVRSLAFYDFNFLTPAQVPNLSIQQIASIPHIGSFALWSEQARAALTPNQVQALNISIVGISHLTPSQRLSLTASQIRSVATYEIPLLAPTQIPLVAPAQFAAMNDASIVMGFSDAVQAALTRDQLLALPLHVLAGFMRTEPTQYPPTNYVPTVETPIGADGIQISPHMDAEAQSLYALVPLSSVTHATVGSGNWSDPRIWANGQAPTPGANVLIGAGHSVRFDVYSDTALRTLRIDGALSFAVNLNTQLKVDTVVVRTGGSLNIGTANAPIQDNVVARILIAGNGPIDSTWDPYLLSRGLISRGSVRMFGRTVTPYATLAANPRAGATTLSLTQIPTGWRVGDELIVAGTNALSEGFDTDRVRIRAISGTTITVDALKYDHIAPEGYGFSIQVANLTRNIQLMAEDASVYQQRPHLLFMHNPDVVLENIGIYGFGRTDKDREINSPIVINGVMQPGSGLNARGRYAMHFHHTGVNPSQTAASVRGSIISGSPGWGFVNHSSNVDFVNNVAFNVFGAGFASEDGNEIGSMRNNLAIGSRGSGDFILSRRANHDFGHGGHGFWLQGPGVELTGNIAAANGGGAFAYLTSSSKNLFDAVNLDDPSLASTRAAVPVGSVPLKRFDGNTAYSSQIGLEIWFHQTMLTDGQTVISNFSSWNTVLFGIELPYSARVKIANATLVGDLRSFSGVGILTNRMTHDVVMENVRVEGFGVGVIVPPRRATVINGGHFSNVENLHIEKGHDTIRTVDIRNIAFTPVSTAQLRGRQPLDIRATGAYNFGDFLDRRIDSLFSADNIRVTLPSGVTVKLAFYEQHPSYVPFPYFSAAGFIPALYLNRSNAFLKANFNVAFGGEVAPSYPTSWPGITAFVTVIGNA